MLTKEQITRKLRDNNQYFSDEFGLKKIGLFGSYARGTQKDESDIDIVADFERPIGLKFIEFVEYLETLFGKKTDVITVAGMEYDDFLVDLKTQDSVIRNIEIIGEAVKNLSPRNPEYGWLIYQEMIVWQKSYIPPISSAGQHSKPHCPVRERLMKL
ncbi:MAG: DUF86 domain-containing protein [Candidatus Electrothrix sp. AW2]|nr:DUF86 domain-containing protein [Candidatus Electrothrix gigas]